MDAIDTFKHGTLTVKIFPDDCGESPREWDNLGKIVHWHRRYDFGERLTVHPDAWLKSLPKGSVVVKIGLLDHSGLHIWAGGGAHWSDSAGWDSGTVGFIYATPEMIKEAYNVKRVTPAKRLVVEKVLEGEIKTFDQFLSGDVYGYVVEDSDGNQLESCWGYYGVDECKAKAKSMAECCERPLAIAANI